MLINQCVRWFCIIVIIGCSIGDKDICYIPAAVGADSSINARKIDALFINQISADID